MSMKHNVSIGGMVSCNKASTLPISKLEPFFICGYFSLNIILEKLGLFDVKYSMASRRMDDFL